MLTLAIILSILMLLVCVFDARNYIIPNWLVGLVIIPYPALLILSPTAVDWPMALAAFVGSFVIGFILFSSKVMGGGDVKLLAACCLWTGTKVLALFLLYTSALGGILALLLLLGRPVVNFYAARLCPEKTLPRLFRHGEPVPYGIAIAIVFLILLWTNFLPNFELSVH